MLKWRLFFAYFFLLLRDGVGWCIRVCIRDAKEAFSVRPRYPEQFTYMVLDVEDNEEQNLIRLFPGYASSLGRVLADVLIVETLVIRAKQFIDQAINSGGRVLVHCNGKAGAT